MPRRGDAFWLKGTGTSANPGTPHLFCVVTDPCSKVEQLIVNVTSRYAGVPFDMACPLDVGDHPDISRPSFVIYQHARWLWPKAYETWQFGHQVAETTPFSEDVLNRIENGVTVSEFATPRVKAYFEANRRR
jgi:hypothetical protein